MDLRHIPSMRRNEIISDIFGRLHYMDRRGSGIGRILNSYAEFAQKPDFFSTEYYFLVVLPNRSVADPAQVTIDFTKTQSESEITQSRPEITQLKSEITQSAAMKTPLVAGSDGFIQDWELIYFREVFLKEHGKTFRTRTQERILTLFTRYRYTYNFNRRNVADLFKITENGASGFISKCIDSGIIKRIKVDEYCFISEKEQMQTSKLKESGCTRMPL